MKQTYAKPNPEQLPLPTNQRKEKLYDPFLDNIEIQTHVYQKYPAPFVSYPPRTREEEENHLITPCTVKQKNQPTLQNL